MILLIKLLLAHLAADFIFQADGWVRDNHWEAVGFLLAAKSVFRFGNLKESHGRKLTEYVLIGTLLSFALALAISLLTSEVLDMHGFLNNVTE